MLREVYMNKKQRSSNMELLRIFSMLIIVLHHCAVHGKFDFGYAEFIPNRLGIRLISLGQLGVMMFMMITGYYQCKSVFKWKKPALVWAAAEFYSLGIYIITLVTGYNEFSWEDLYSSAAIVLHRRYWFVNAYIAVYLLSPVLNAFAEKASRTQFLTVLCSMTAALSVLPTLTGRDIFLESGKSVMWMSIVYLTGAYLRYYPDARVTKRRIALAGAAGSLVLFAAATVYVDRLIMADESMKKYASHIYDDASFTPMFTLALCIFALFTTVDIPYSKVINFIGASTFGIYLIHDNAYMRKILWVELFGFNKHMMNTLLIPYMGCCAIVVFICCMLTDKVRALIFSAAEKLISKRTE